MMEPITLYNNGKTKIVYVSTVQVRYVKIYQFDADGYVENMITFYDADTIETFLEKF